jgi:osmotically-inducible protein OsmY
MTIFDKLWNRNGHSSKTGTVDEIFQALHSYSPLDATAPPIEIEVVDGVVTLRGAVRGAGIRDMAGKLAATVEGIEAVNNELLDDPTIEGKVARVLAAHPDLGLSTTLIHLKSYHGVVTLSGPVSSQAQQMAAEAVTRSVPGVANVINRLDVLSNGNGNH